MGNQVKECFCLECNEKRRVGRDARTDILDGECYVYCSVCDSELYGYKVSVKKSRDVKANHKSRTVKE